MKVGDLVKPSYRTGFYIITKIEQRDTTVEPRISIEARKYMDDNLKKIKKSKSTIMCDMRSVTTIPDLIQRKNEYYAKLFKVNQEYEKERSS